jgi:hypothetical protein
MTMPDDNAPQIKFDDLAEKLVSDPSKPLDAVTLTGFLGRSTQEGSVRLYDDAGFRGYYEISTADILHQHQLPTTQAPFGGSLVYVKRSARLRRVQVSAETEAQFIEGPMTSAAATSAARASSMLVANRAPVVRFTLIPLCRTDARTSCADVCVVNPTRACGGDTSPFDCD